jgi:hypothetical protein
MRAGSQELIRFLDFAAAVDSANSSMRSDIAIGVQQGDG